MLNQLQQHGCGFQPLLKNDRFQCAFITHDRQYSYGNIDVIKRHMTSDEVFVLLRGSASLVTADGEWKNRRTTHLQPGVVYCLKAGTWHHLAVSEDALLFVTENNDVSAQNTETVYLEEEYADK